MGSILQSRLSRARNGNLFVLVINVHRAEFHDLTIPLSRYPFQGLHKYSSPLCQYPILQVLPISACNLYTNFSRRSPSL